MSCLECGHEEHAPAPCGTCALVNSNCFQGINIVGGDGDKSATGQIEMATGMEERPCCLCRSFEQDSKKLRQHLLARGLTPDANGVFTTPIAKDFQGRQSLRIDPRSYGYCRRQSIPVDLLATCNDWSPVKTSSELESRIKT